MAATAEAPQSLVIPQPQSPFETDFEVPSHFVDTFQSVTQLTYGNHTPLPHLVAAYVAEDGKASDDVLAEQVHSLADADQYIRENPGAPFINADRACLTSGVVGENNGLTVVDWSSEIGYGTGLVVPAAAYAEVGFSGNRIRTAESKVPYDGYIKFMTPGTAVTPESVDGVDFVERTAAGGILAVGEKAVQSFFGAVSKREAGPESKHLLDALKIAMPVLDLARN